MAPDTAEKVEIDPGKLQQHILGAAAVGKEVEHARVMTGSSVGFRPFRGRYDPMTSVAKALHAHPPTIINHPPPPPLLEYKWDNITFPSGVPVGGWADLTLHESGACELRAHFHDSGFPSFDIALSYVIVLPDIGRAFSFSGKGHMAGTDESGSRDVEIDAVVTSQAIADVWEELTSGHVTWRAEADVNLDIGPLVDDITTAIKYVGEVIAVIVAIV